MTITTGDWRFDYERKVEPDALPQTLLYRGNPALGVFVIVFAVFWFATILLIAQTLFSEPFPIPLVPFVFLIPALGLVYVGLRTILGRVEVTIGRDKVTVRERRWFRTTVHEVPLAAYPGVLRARVSYTRNKKTYVAWLAALPHAERAKRVVLAATRDEAEGRRLVEDYARRLGKPALEETTDGFATRAPEDLDTPLARLAAEGKVASDWRPDRSAPAEVRVEHRPDAIVVSLLKGPMPLWLGAALAGFGAVVAFTFVGFGKDEAAQIAGGLVGAVIFGGVMWGVFSGLRTTRQILVTRSHVAIASLPKGAAEPRIEHEMAHGEIEALRIARGPQGGQVLWFDTDRGSFQTGTNMPRHALVYVRDLIVAAIATAGQGGGTSP